jgi:tRNA G26 N,N-dimethylase Trm1
MTKTDVYTTVLEDGSSVECNRLSLCCINDYLRNSGVRGIRYQVDCDDYRFKFSQLYEDLEKAVKKYVEIKRKLYV